MTPQAAQLLSWLRAEAKAVQSVIEMFDKEDPNSSNLTLADFRKYALTADLIESLTTQLAAQAEVARQMREALEAVEEDVPDQFDFLGSGGYDDVRQKPNPRYEQLQAALAIPPTEAEQRAAENAVVSHRVQKLISSWRSGLLSGQECMIELAHEHDAIRAAREEDCAQAVDTIKPHWRCKCGTVAMPLTDDTQCKCEDYYEQDWTRIDPAAKAKAQKESGDAK